MNIPEKLIRCYLDAKAEMLMAKRRRKPKLKVGPAECNAKYYAIEQQQTHAEALWRKAVNNILYYIETQNADNTESKTTTK